jgi:urease accessory protein
MQHRFLNTIFLIAAYAFCTGVSAHTGVENHSHNHFLTGFIHPLMGLDHLAAMVCVGLWSALVARRAGPEMLWGPAAFAILLLAGAVLGLQGVQIAAVEPMIAASLLVMGLLVSTRLRMPGLLAAPLVGAFALFHGLAHGYELVHNADAAQTMAGMLLATLLLHASGLWLGWVLRHRSVWLPRVAGAAVAVFGAVLLAQLA